ncbi:MAG: hypothetical protein J7L15_07365 [Clostridiales bacterium]|nr:hypothetical protein [Clostridiales bacterium]
MNKKGNFWSLLYALCSLTTLIIIYIVFTPVIDKYLEVGNDLINSSEGKSLLTLSATLWYKVVIGILIIGIIIYVIASALQKEPYSEEYYRR